MTGKFGLAETVHYKIYQIVNGPIVDSDFSGSSCAIASLDSGYAVAYKDQTKEELPASLAKLFCLDYALTMAKADEEVEISPLAIQMQKENSSSAYLVAGDVLTVKDLAYAMMLPSGNDAAYALAIYCGSKFNSEVATDEDCYNTFMFGLNRYLQDQGYKETHILDASGYDFEATSSAKDVKNVCLRLFKEPLFTEIAHSSTYETSSALGYSYSWQTTIQFMQEGSSYYRDDVFGIKTGSLDGKYNLCVAYTSPTGRQYVLVSFAAATDEARYADASYLLDQLA